MGKSRGERRVIFSSSGAIRTICSLLRRHRLVLVKIPSDGGSKTSVCGGLQDVDDVDDNDGDTPANIAVAGEVDEDSGIEREKNAIIDCASHKDSSLHSGHQILF